ncbi:hypothetical protein NDU88_006786 [Pleurodeles waltl]|uniref:Uncharacterized protein n=1 Tax=Pleurodeles waltl TaxID=8319 RepID=A0AAV7RP21_PLEWA|nr:hypothetical protein NDU88_006786 [Pleurodeles waltl]
MALDHAPGNRGSPQAVDRTAWEKLPPEAPAARRLIKSGDRGPGTPLEREEIRLRHRAGRANTYNSILDAKQDGLQRRQQPMKKGEKPESFCFATNGVDEDWTVFRDVIYNTALALLDQNSHKHQDWFDDNDENIQKLLDEKHEAFRSLQQDATSVSKKSAYNSIQSKVQAKLREMQDSWLSKKAVEIQKYADSNNFKGFYDVLKTIYGPQSSGTSPLLCANVSTLFTD